MYDNLIKRLKEIHPEEFGDAWDFAFACQQAMCEAADAIEELTQKEKFHSFLWNTIQPNEMELYIAMYRAQAVPQEPPKEEV